MSNTDPHIRDGDVKNTPTVKSSEAGHAPRGPKTRKPMGRLITDSKEVKMAPAMSGNAPKFFSLLAFYLFRTV